MKQKLQSAERRTCSLVAPYIYFMLELSVVVLLTYIFTGGEPMSRHGLIILVIGAAYPALKLPTYLGRARQCKRYGEVNRSKRR